MERSPRIDKRTIERCKAGDRQTFEEIVLFYQKRVFNFAYRMLGNAEEAKEVSQEIFVSVFKSISELREEVKFDGWLKQIMLNHCRNRWNYLKRRQYFRMNSIDDPVETGEGEVPRPIPDPSDPPDLLYERKLDQALIQKGLQRLKEDRRELIVLRDLQGFSYEEVGRLLSLPEGTVKSKLHRARMDLKEALKGMMH